MDVAHHFDAISKIAIEDEISANRKMPNASSDIVARHTDLRVARKRLAFLVENIEKPIGRGGILAGDVGPDVDQILFGLRRAP